MLHRFLARTIARMRDSAISENVTANQVSESEDCSKEIPKIELCIGGRGVCRRGKRKMLLRHAACVSSARTSRINPVVRIIVTSNEVKDSVIKDPVSWSVGF